MKDFSYKRWKPGFTEYGFTIIELMVAMALGLIITGVSYGTYVSVQRSFSSQEQISDIQSTSMITLDILSNDIKETGFGIPNLFKDINKRTKVIEYTDNNGAFSSDKLFLLGAYKQIAALNKAAKIGENTIEIKYLSGNTVRFDVNEVKNYASIMGLQYIEITEVNTIEEDIDTLTFSGASITKNFPEDTPLYLIEDVAYWVEDDEGKGVLRKSGRYGMPQPTYSIADNIDDMQIVGFDQNNDRKFERLQLFLLSKTERPDLNYRDKGHDFRFDEATQEWSLSNTSDSYRRRLLSISASFRNKI